MSKADPTAADGPTHRAEIARRIGVSRTTVTTITRDLLGRGVLEEQFPVDSEGVDGRAGGRLTFPARTGWTAGITYGLDRVAVVVQDLVGNPLGTDLARFDPEAPWPERADHGVKVLTNVVDRAGGRTDLLVGIGVGLPGQVDSLTGVVHGALASQPWHGVDARAQMQRRTGVPVVVENNVRLEAIAEVRRREHPVDELLYVHISSGIAATLITAGSAHRGANGGAGELGHMSVDITGPSCRCGNRGCAVLYAGASAILDRLRSSLGADITMDDVLAAHAAGDPSVSSVLEEVGILVGRLLVSVSNLLNPPVIVVGGQTAEAGEVLLAPLRHVVRSYALAPAGSPAVEAAVLGGRARGPQAGQISSPSVYRAHPRCSPD